MEGELMPGFLLHLGATVMCAHAGQATPVTPNPRVLVSGQPTVPMTSLYAVAGCTLPPPAAANGPCVTAQYITAATQDHQQRRPAAADRQPGDLHALRNAIACDRHANQGHGSLTMMHVDFPYRFDARGRTAGTDEADHIRDLIEQVLFTSPGERVMRPDFGSGLLQLVFAPNSEVLAATTQVLVQSVLQRWLGELIVVEGVRVEAVESTLRVIVQYVIRRTGTRVTGTFVQGGGA
jgi:phage baseplate assembly protein W